MSSIEVDSAVPAEETAISSLLVLDPHDITWPANLGWLVLV